LGRHIVKKVKALRTGLDNARK
jgi:hypothetical protein